jgi:hypothetical protein
LVVHPRRRFGGVGPAIYWQTASSTYLGPRKWGAGPTIVVPKQASGWTYGVLANHIWSFAGESETPGGQQHVHPAVHRLRLARLDDAQPEHRKHLQLVTDEWTVPINLTLGHIYRLGTQPVNFQIGGRYYAITPQDGPRWGVRFAMVFLFPAG